MRNVADAEAEAHDRVIDAMTGFYERFALHDAARYFGQEDFAQAIKEDRLIVGSPETVRTQLTRILTASGVHHFAAAFSFGTLTYAESRASLTRFAKDVSPALRSLRLDLVANTGFS